METSVTENAAPTGARIGEGLTFEKVWASIQESRLEIQESRQEWKEKMEADAQKRDEEREKERREWDSKREESQKKWDREQKESQREWDKKFGHLHNRFGELAEHLVAPGINERFNELGYHFDEEASGGVKIKEDGKVKAEIDLLLQNDDTVMAVEVKSKPDEDDIPEHIQRIEVLRDHRRKKNDLRRVEGAIAGAIFGTAVKRAVIKAGLYVIEQSGDTMRIEVPEGFVPRKW